MTKRILITIALAACLAGTAPADYEMYFFGPTEKDTGVRIDGNVETRWPIGYEKLTVCTIPIKIRVGMFVQVKDCREKVIILEQVNCGNIGRGDIDYPCYLGCVDFDVRANFPVKLGSSLHKHGDVIGDWSAYYDGGDRIPDDGDWHGAKLCVKAWKTRVYKAAPGKEVSIGSVDITVMPDI